MLLENKTGFRTPRIVSNVELAKCKKCVEKIIRKHLSTGAKTFTVKDLFGGDNWDWNAKNWYISILYDKYYDKYSSWAGVTGDDADVMAYKQAGIEVGNIVKLVVESMPEKFRLSNASGWSLTYTLVTNSK